MTDFNLEKEFGWLLDGIENYVDGNLTDFLSHHGVAGMKWGRHKAKTKSTVELKTLGPDKITRKTKSGEEITLSKIQPGPITKFLAKYSKGVRNSVANSASLDIKDSSGKKVGYASIEKRSKDELYLNWIGIDSSARGKGYATAVMKAAEGFGKESGFKKMTLEVPGNSPDARHIYEKLGFKVVKEDKDPNDLVWGGLTSMVYNFDSAKHSDVVDDFLLHYGVAGMKWGKRSSKSKTAKNPAQIKKSKARRDLAITAGLGTTMVLSMAVGGIRTSNINAAQTHQRHDFSDVMGLPMSSVKVSYNPHSNIWE